MRIKNIYSFIIFTTLLAFSTTSCQNYLDVEPKSSFNEAYVFSSVAGTTTALLGVYSALTGDWGYGGRLSLFYTLDADDMTLGYSASSDNGLGSLARYNSTAANTQFETPFNQLYTGVERANICIYNIPKMSLYTSGSDSEQRELKRLYGEALTLRALFYLELIRNWGDLPAQFESSYMLPDLYLEKTDRDIIYEHLLEDLALASTLVPWRGEPGVVLDERITKAAVKGLRARIALYRGGFSLRNTSKIMERGSKYLTYYQIAKDECKEIMESNRHSLNPSFRTVFKDFFNAKKIEANESIFEVAMAGKSGNDSRLADIDGTSVFGKGQAFILALPTYFYSFDSLDTRRDVTVASYLVNTASAKIGRNIVGLNSAKFRRDWLSNPAITPANTDLYFGINWPILRYSDVLLMFAEADNEINGGPTPEAGKAFEMVRMRAFAGNTDKMGTTPSGKDEFFKAVVKERWFEFGGEGIRKYDLIRWNLLNEKITESRSNLTKILKREAPYENLPQTMYYKTSSPDLVYANSFYKPAPATAPAGYSPVAWTSSLTTGFISLYAELFQPNKKEILPLPQAAINGNPKLTQDFGN